MDDLVATAARFNAPRELIWNDETAARYVWGMRLFIVPHILVGIGTLGAMLASLLWLLLGTTWQAKVVDASLSPSPGGTTCYVTWSSPREDLQHSEKLACSQVTELKRPGATVPVRTLDMLGVRYDRLWLPVLPTKNLLFFPWLFGLIWNGFMALAVHTFYVVPAQQRDLLARGSPTAGTVTSKRTRRGKVTKYVFEYSYQTPEGPKEGEAEVRSKDRWDAITKGSKVLVFYDPQHPKRSVTHAYGPYRVVGLEPG